MPREEDRRDGDEAGLFGPAYESLPTLRCKIERLFVERDEALAELESERTRAEKAGQDRDEARALAEKLRSRLERPGGQWQWFPWDPGYDPERAGK
jgi:hypothetical protein